MTHRYSLLGFSSLALLACVSRGNAQSLAPIADGTITIRAEIVASGLAGSVGGEFQISPTDIVPDGSGRLFVTTLGGVVRLIDQNRGLQPTPYLTASQTETTPAANGEWGMTSLAFHPDFLNGGAAGYGKFYSITTEPPGANSGAVDFSVAIDHQDVIKEWTADNPTQPLFSGSVREVMRVGQPGEPHNVFDLAFDNDGYLYVSSGDGGFDDAFRSQDPGSIHGKVLRIDPLPPGTTSVDRGVLSANGAYRVPTDNPFFGQPDALDETWALGLRSPFRMNFDRETGDLWIGDVGAGRIEEINQVVAGGNYGWPYWEGTRPIIGNPPPGLTFPEFQYSHDFDGVSVIGGFVYRGTAIPELVGKYVFADLGERLPNAQLYYGDPETGERFRLLLDPAGETFLGRLGPETGDELPLPERIISIGEDADGELYLAAVGIDPRQGGGLDGMVVRLAAPLAAGDFNGDGRVDNGDLSLLLGNWGSQQVPPSWVNGFTAPIDNGELGALLSTWGAGASASVVPEPTGLFLLLLAFAGTATRRCAIAHYFGPAGGSK